MRFLAFGGEETWIGARRVRVSRFEDRSLLPVSAACVVANGVRETLGQLLGSPVAVRLFEPSIPGPDGWNAIGCNARMYAVYGSRSDGAIVVRANDAARLAGAAFGETGRGPSTLSDMESAVLERLIGALGGQLTAVCGNCAERPRSIDALLGFSTYFEVHVEEPVDARIGIALASEPLEQHQATLTLDDLHGVELELAVRLDCGNVEAGHLAGLAVGGVLPVGHPAATRGIAYLAGRALGRGECGVLGRRYALSIGTSIEGSIEPSL